MPETNTGMTIGTPGAGVTVNTESPNMRFGYSGLDLTLRKRAVKDEVLIDKRTGEMLYKRKEDGKIVSTHRDLFPVYEYLSEVKALTSTYVEYIRPNRKNCKKFNNTHFLTTKIDLMEFQFEEGPGEPQSFFTGGVYANPHASEFSITQEQNGFFVKLVGRSKDQALVAMLNNIYNETYKNYEGTDDASITENGKFSNVMYENSQAIVNYTVTFYADGVVFAQTNASGYVRINEVSYIPFPVSTIYSRDTVDYATLKINSISTPKLAKGMDLLAKSPLGVMVDSFKDNEDLDFQSLFVSAFITPTDEHFTLSPKENSFPALIMAMEEFENEMKRIASGEGGSGTSAGGLLVQKEMPDEVKWNKTLLWIKPVADVFASGDTDDYGEAALFGELEEYFGSFEKKSGILTDDIMNAGAYFIEVLRQESMELPW